MYCFWAHYTHIPTEQVITKEIRFDGQFFNNEKECYIYAMGKAYDMKEDCLSLDGIELIYC